MAVCPARNAKTLPGTDNSPASASTSKYPALSSLTTLHETSLKSPIPSPTGAP